jgi:hypothetical protein
MVAVAQEGWLGSSSIPTRMEPQAILLKAVKGEAAAVLVVTVRLLPLAVRVDRAEALAEAAAEVRTQQPAELAAQAGTAAPTCSPTSRRQG